VDGLVSLSCKPSVIEQQVRAWRRECGARVCCVTSVCSRLCCVSHSRDHQVYSVKDLYPGQPLEVTVLEPTAGVSLCRWRLAHQALQLRLLTISSPQPNPA
jgi:hypothetical protein